VRKRVGEALTFWDPLDTQSLIGINSTAVTPSAAKRGSSRATQWCGQTAAAGDPSTLTQAWRL
jgi:hypothetical protein